ncbi:hypothetical protein [Actinomyces succiniciruminis]|uniref:Uncharacterized protein n=1 Tax=Actinomyces succiniciruminis TaxID=1522002 RepID=A0A1L7RP81_9ACTO|nr:hypothetical protein [Actinomyces succiniciruminis]CED91124.1 Hypothetical protein AAM4_1292 [Actinomyces succiniciruminis]
MALRFNPPPNWPAPPEGFTPPPGWQPDPAWGPAPEGWQLWVEDSTPGASAGSAAQSGPAEAGLTPGQAPSSPSAPVADPTGQSASAPSGDYAGGASPYAANMDYAQSPTPYHNQQPAPGASPQAAGWQPIDVGQGGAPGGNKPVTKQWWFWTIIAVVVLALVIGLIVALTGGDDESDTRTGTTTSSRSSDDSRDTTSNDTSGDDTSDDTDSDDATSDDADNSGSSSDVGTTMDNPADPEAGPITFKAGEYEDDPDASFDVEFGSVEWDATSAVETEAGKYRYEDPGNGNVYMRVPVTVTYHGKGKMDSYDLTVDFVKDGNTTEATSLYIDSEFGQQDMPRDGGSATGYFMFILSEEDAKAQQGVFAVEGYWGTDELYMEAKSF